MANRAFLSSWLALIVSCTSPASFLIPARAQSGNTGGFQQKLAGFRRRYSNRPAMLRRIDKL